MIYLCCKKTDKCFLPMLENIKWLLQRAGYQSKIVHQVEQNDSLWFMIWNGFPILPRFCILYNMDPMLDHIYNEFKTNLANSSGSKVHCIVNYCYGPTLDRIKTFGYPVQVLPYGYSDYHNFIKTTLAFNESGFVNLFINNSLQKPIDILFYGSVDARRAEYIKDIETLSSKKGYNFKRFDGIHDDAEKLKYICNSKIVVSIASGDAKVSGTNDLARIAQIISVGGFVITESIGDVIVEGKMKDYVPHFNSKEEMIRLIDHYLLIPRQDNRHRFSIDFPFEKELLSLVSSF